MILTALVASVAAFHQAGPVSLARTFVKGEKLEYEVTSSLETETRGRGLETWLPGELDVNYKFTTQVLELKPDGIVEMTYKRPTETHVQGETPERGPVTTVEKPNLDFHLTLSPVNEILNIKDVAKKPVPPKKSGGGWRMPNGNLPSQIPMIGQFIQELYRLSLFTGSFDSALDFAPKLPLDQVKVGDTWQRTVGYSPQKLKGKDGKSAVQRLDYTFTFKGLVPSKSGQVYRVTATLGLDTDLNDFINQTYEVTSDDTGLKSLPLKLKATVDFDLDPQTKRTLRAVAHTDGGFKIIATSEPDDPAQEQKIKGDTTLRLVSATVAPVPSATEAGSKKGTARTRKHG